MFQFAREDANSVEGRECLDDLLNLAFNGAKIGNVDLLYLAVILSRVPRWFYLESLKSFEFGSQSFQTLHSATRCNDPFTLSMEASRESFSQPRGGT